MLGCLSLCALISLFSLLTAAAYMLYSGLLSGITVLTGSPPIKKITFAYKFTEQPYRNRGQLFRESLKIGPKLACIGVYYDAHNKVPGSQCRYAVGSILSEGENKADEELLKSYETSGFNIFSFPEVTHVVTTSFPCRTLFSIRLIAMRVYPRLENYIKAAISQILSKGGSVEFARQTFKHDFDPPAAGNLRLVLNVTSTYD
ncbi:Testis-expressed protein 264 [Collichthys lucidus]|uniref:Testis-expressed protein 264 n=1 Tax=Collichthys lucidus TaxID=240159 RepID=A0A4U5UBK8_COLLU|nr:Testis-expressed protein 264 [Collichthys lucidus]